MSDIQNRQHFAIVSFDVVHKYSEMDCLAVFFNQVNNLDYHFMLHYAFVCLFLFASFLCLIFRKGNFVPISIS